MAKDLQQILIAPSILAANLGKLTEEVKMLETAGADWIHIDVMDGSFVPPITFGQEVVSVCRKATKLELDVHLMINNPERQLESFAAAGANRISVHQETCPHLHRTLSQIRSMGLKSGVVLNPATPVPSIFDVLEMCDLVLIMTVNPGWGGQKFIPQSIEKIKQLHVERAKQKSNFLIQVDGGINLESFQACLNAGADVLVAGSAIFQSKDPKGVIKRFKD